MGVIALSEDDAAKRIINAIKAKEKENDKARKFYIFTDLKNP